jgi:hypothetical protein
MVAYLCAILCSVIGVRGNIQKQWSDYELKALYTKKIEKCLGINPWVNKEQQRNPTQETIQLI